MLSPKQAAQPNPSYPALSSGHHISIEHRLRRKQLNSDTNASHKTFLKEIQEQRKEDTFFLEKNDTNKNKKRKRKKMFLLKKWTREKKRKRGSPTYSRDGPKNGFFTQELSRVSFPKKIDNSFWGVTVFPHKSDKFHWT